MNHIYSFFIKIVSFSFFALLLTTQMSYAVGTCTGTPWGDVPAGYSNTAYQSATAPYGTICTSEVRTCENLPQGDTVLSGSYTYTSCVVASPVDCTAPWGGTVLHGNSTTTYQSSSVAYGSSCVSQSRTCSNGVLSGSYTNRTCAVSCGVQPISWGTCSGNTVATSSGTTIAVSNTSSGGSGSVGARCTNGSWSTLAGTCDPVAPSDSPTGTLFASPSSCTVSTGSGSCNSLFTWTTSNPVWTSQVIGDGGGPTSTPANNDSQSLAVPYGGKTFRLYNNSEELASTTIAAVCASNAAWGGASCQTCSNGGCTNHLCDNGANNPVSCNQCPDSLAWDAGTSSCIPCLNGGCIGGGGSSSIPLGTLVCNNTYTPPTCAVTPTTTGTLDAVPTPCFVADGDSTCDSAFTWTTTNPVVVGMMMSLSQVVADGGAGPDSNPLGANDDTETLAVPHGGKNFRLYHHGEELAQKWVGAACLATSAWNGSACQTCDNGGCGTTAPPHVCNNGGTNAPTCSPPLCTNGTNDYPSCTQCPDGQAWDLFMSQCTSCFNGGCTGGGGTPSTPAGTLSCINGANNPHQCTTYPAGTITANPTSCSITLGNNSCTTLLTWTTAYPSYGFTSQVVADGGSGPDSVAANNGSQTLIIPHGGSTFRLYHNSQEITASPLTVDADCSVNTSWDASTDSCVNPQTGTVAVTGQHYYTSPEALTFTCVDSTHFRITKDGSPYQVKTPYTSETVIPLSVSGSYGVICIMGTTESSPTMRDYDSTPPIAGSLTIDARPKTISPNAKAVVTWSIPTPPITAPLCKLYVKAVCANGLCTASEIAASSTLQTVIDTANIDDGTRLITDAVSTIPASQVGQPTPTASGKKTFTIAKTTDFVLDCGVGKIVNTRVRVTGNSEE